MTSETDGNEGRDPTRSKVGRLIAEYDLDDLGADLERRWTGEDTERQSLRELADEFNQRLLRTSMVNAGDTPLDGEVENLYRLLTDDEASAGARTRAERSLERQGIDVDDLTSAFVSHQAIHTYLTRYRGVESVDDDAEPNAIENAQEAIQRLQNRLIAVVEKNLRVFSNTGRITLGSFHVLVSVQVYCEDCNTQYPVSELLDRGRCDCD